LVSRIMAILQDRLPRHVTDVKFLGSPEPALRIEFRDGHSVTAKCCIRHQLRPSTLPLVESTCLKSRHSIVFTNFVSRPLAERLREKNIWFADACGNIYIELPGRLLLLSLGATPHRQYLERASVVTENGAKLMLYLLVHGPEIGTTYREIAEQSGLSLGSVSVLMKALMRQQVVEGGRRHYRVTDGARLLELWIQAYLEKLKPRRILGRFLAPQRNDVKELIDVIRREDLPVIVGGEAGAGELTGYLRAVSAELWLEPGDFESVRNRLRLMASPEGNIVVHANFNPRISEWSPKKRIAPVPMLIGDLVAVGDARCIETAQEIQKEYLQWTVR